MSVLDAMRARSRSLEAHHCVNGRKAVEIKIGVQNVARELVLETDATAAELADLVEKALSGATLVVKDIKGRSVIVPSNAVAYVELGEEEVRRVGFGSI